MSVGVKTNHAVAEQSEVVTVNDRDRREFERFLVHAGSVEGEAKLSLRAWIDLAEIWRITEALREARGNRSAAARALGIGRRTLYAKMDKLGITPTWGVVKR
jgi:transcriptional regulator with PAS, ATPase and Fis domain